MAYPADLKYTKDHEWLRVSGDVAEVGITNYAQEQLGDVVFVELPDVGRQVNAAKRSDRSNRSRRSLSSSRRRAAKSSRSIRR
jgi:hypothetical protein